jgi:hypothetical protein
VRDRLTIPPRTVDQLRTLERHGLCDGFIAKDRKRPTAGSSVLLLWHRPKRRRGEVALYSLLDVATARLVGWMLKEGLSLNLVRQVLRGPDQTAGALLLWALEHVPGATLVLSTGGSGFIMSAADLREPDRRVPGFYVHRFPLAWLGLERDVLPRLQKMREDKPEVIRWRQAVAPAVLHAEAAHSSGPYGCDAELLGGARGPAIPGRGKGGRTPAGGVLLAGARFRCAQG